jgi:hypothetical protein
MRSGRNYPRLLAEQLEADLRLISGSFHPNAAGIQAVAGEVARQLHMGP